MSERERASLKRMRDAAINRNLLGDARVEEAFLALVGTGRDPEDVERAWLAHQDRLRAEGREDRYMTQLLRWLTDPSTPLRVREATARRESGDGARGPARPRFVIGRDSRGRGCVMVSLGGRIETRPSWPVDAGEAEWTRLWKAEGGGASKCRA